MKKWKCSVCGYIHEGDEPPEKCPLCGAEKDKFIQVTDSEESASQGTEEEEGAPKSLENEVDISAAGSPQEQLTMLEKITDLVLKNHLHPISVHSPNGIVPIAVLFLALGILFKSQGLANAAYYNMIAVLLSMPLVIFTGYVTWQKKYNGAKTSVFKIKIAASIVATVILIGLVTWKTVQPDVLISASLDRWLFLFWSSFMLAAIGLAGHLGGQLVFGNKK